jgi:hypothetical protein
MPPLNSATETVPPPAGERADRVHRIASAAARDTLERISSSEALTAGSVNTIGLDAIRRKLDDRWPQKAPRVWEHVEREIERTLGPTGVFIRLDDISYLIAQPGEDGFAAQAVCLTILQDVLKFFLGELRPADISVRTVTQINGGEIATAPVDPATLRRRPAPRPASPAERAAEAVTGPLADHAPAPKPWQPPLAGRTCNIALAPPKREPFELTLCVEPVWNLRRGLITSFLVDRSGAPAKPEASDFEEIDVATMAYVSTLMEEHMAQGGTLALHVPITFATLATQRSRERLLRLIRPALEAMRTAMLIEIDGLDSGVPPSRLIEVVGLVRSLCAGVLGRVRPTKAALEAVRGCGLRGLVVEAPWLGLTAGGGAARMKAYATMAREVAPNILIHGLPLPEMVDEAAAAGFTHASVAPGATPTARH